jgi:hypothetical protein
MSYRLSKADEKRLLRGVPRCAILIEEDLAVPFLCSPTHCPKTPRALVQSIGASIMSNYRH